MNLKILLYSFVFLSGFIFSNTQFEEKDILNVDEASSTFNISFSSNWVLLNINPDRKTNEYNKIFKFIEAL